MSPEFDLDRLADYTAGVLDSDEAQRVTWLIATDATWARAHAGLVRADVSVRGDLREEARAEHGPMPADVVARLDQALAHEGLARLALTGSAAGPARTASRRRSTGRAGWRRLAVGLAAVAAGVVAVIGGVGVVAQQLRSPAGGTAAQQDAGASDAGVTPRTAPQATAGAAGALTGLTLVSSGNDYGPRTLDRVPRPASAPSERLPGSSSQGRAPSAIDATEVLQTLRGVVAAPLARLAEPGALAACLSAVRADHPGTPAVVDYARYQGAPALIILVRTSGPSAVVAVGPSCGVQGGADETAFATVG